MKFAVNSNDKVLQVRCKVCSHIESYNKLLCPKLDGLRKHCGRKKALVDTLGRPKGMIYFESNNIH